MQLSPNFTLGDDQTFKLLVQEIAQVSELYIHTYISENSKISLCGGFPQDAKQLYIFTSLQVTHKMSARVPAGTRNRTRTDLSTD